MTGGPRDGAISDKEVGMDEKITIPVIGGCLECGGTGIIEGELPCAECRDNGGGHREMQFSPQRLAELLYPHLDAIDRRERIRAVAKLRAEMER